MSRLEVRGLTKRYYQHGVPRTLFQDLTFDLPPGDRIAVIGRNGQGKSTLIKILGGLIGQSGGTVDWGMSCSWPLGFSGGFQGGMSGMDNIRFLSRIYRRPLKGFVERVDEFAELGEALTMPVKYYSSGMRARLAFGLSLAIDFDCYLIDEVIAVGDAAFRAKCKTELFENRKDRAFIIASHDANLLRNNCSRAIIIESGRAKIFEDINLAIDIYKAMSEEHQTLELKRSHSDPLPEGVSIKSPVGIGAS